MAVLALLAGFLLTSCATHAGAAGGPARATAGARAGAQQQAQRPERARRSRRGDAGDGEARCDRAQVSVKEHSKPVVDRIGHEGRLVVGVDQNSFLWGYRNPNSGSIEGFDIDIVHAIAKDLSRDLPGKRKLKVVYKAIATPDRQCAIDEGRVDMVVRTVTIDRKKPGVAFSDPYYPGRPGEAGQRLVVPKGSGIKGIGRSMKGKRVCLARRSSAETVWNGKRASMRYLGKAEEPDNQLDCLMRMQRGKVDATLTDSALGVGQAAQDPSVKVLDHSYTEESYGVAMNPRDKDLVSRVDGALKTYMTGGRDSPWSRSYRRWLAPHMEGGGGERTPVPPLS